MTSDSKAAPSMAEQVATALGRDDLISRKAAMEAIQSLRHAAACNFSPEYSGSLGQARTDSFYEAYEAVRKMEPAALASTAGDGAGDWQPTDKIMEISRKRLRDIQQAWADHHDLDEGNISFLLRMAGRYLREAPAVPASARSGAETASPPAPAEHGVEIRELRAVAEGLVAFWDRIGNGQHEKLDDLVRQAKAALAGRSEKGAGDGRVTGEALIELLCRVMHGMEGTKDADDPLHAPYQNSWEEPHLVRWMQWREIISTLLMAAAAAGRINLSPEEAALIREHMGEAEDEDAAPAQSPSTSDAEG